MTRRAFGGQTGDVLGATQQVTYVLILMVLSAKI
jgi:cobalamin synthase